MTTVPDRLDTPLLLLKKIVKRSAVVFGVAVPDTSRIVDESTALNDWLLVLNSAP